MQGRPAADDVAPTLGHADVHLPEKAFRELAPGESYGEHREPTARIAIGIADSIPCPSFRAM